MKWIQYFVLFAGVILLVAALTRFLIAFDGVQILALPDPVLAIPLRYAVLLVGVIELAAASLCFFGKRIGLQAGCLALLAVNYAGYRIGAVSMAVHHQATAIGSLSDPLQLTRGMAGMISGLAPVFLLLGGSTSTLWLWLSNRSTMNEKPIKMSCHGCGVHIRFERERLGQQIDCPQCHELIVLRGEETLKMTCYFCKEHIAFPAHAIGEKLQCPHCRNDITLKESIA
jgi:predicted RNA-binding Zn-ribbon protein involved in translation (DUF1610 family)